MKQKKIIEILKDVTHKSSLQDHLTTQEVIDELVERLKPLMQREKDNQK
ncbi:hypothetical protein [Pontibacillus yanchengensis]|nr:hypothetical protein [Pontibacillus yanchengensis]